MKTVGLITYDYPHLKTEQVVERLRGRYNLRLYGLPFVPRPVRPVLFEHRPDQSVAAHPAAIAAAHGFDFVRCASDADVDDRSDVVLVLAGKILSPACVESRPILNCHSGIIPAVRGLDAFKWTILDGRPLGVTLHVIDRDVDAGRIVAVVPTPVYEGDTAASLARRHYENELDVQCRFDEFLDRASNPFEGIAAGQAHLRMGRQDEARMLEAVPAYVKTYAGPIAATARG